MKKYLLDSNGNPINEQKKQKDFNTKTIDHRKKKAQQKLFQNLTAIFTLATFIMTVLSGFRSIMTYTYYGVSLTFFSYDVSKTFVVALKYALIWFGLIGIPYTFYVTKETEKVKRNSRWLLSGVTSFFVVLFSAKDMVGVLRINDLPWWSLIIAYIGLNGLCKYIHPHPIKQYKRFRTTHSAFKKARQFLEGLFYALAAGIFYVSIIMATTAALFLLYPGDKTDYELTCVDGVEKVVLFHQKDYVFVADYTLDDNGEMLIYTKHYKVVDFKDREYSNIKVATARVKSEDLPQKSGLSKDITTQECENSK